MAAVLVLGIPSLAGRAAFDLGTAAHDEGRPAAAGRWLERAVRWDPGQPTYHAYRGQFLAEAGTGDRTAVEAALTELETARRLDPATPYYHFLLGGFYGQVGDPLQAALNYRRAATLFPLNPEYRRAVKASDPSESAP